MVDLKEHTARRNAVQAIEKSLASDLERTRFSLQDLQHLPIQILDMTLTPEGLPSFHPCFFDPYSKPLSDVNCEKSYRNYDPEEDDAMNAAIILRHHFENYFWHIRIVDGIEIDTSRQGGDFRAKLWEYENHGAINWLATAIEGARDSPWFKCMILENVNGDDDHITRGELMCICRIIIKCLSLRCYKDHNIIPVLILSLMGPMHGRIVLGHYDGTNLVLRKSELFDLRFENIAASKFLARWWGASHVGDTTA